MGLDKSDVEYTTDAKYVDVEVAVPRMISKDFAQLFV
jgi:hypothetical protein